MYNKVVNADCQTTARFANRLQRRYKALTNPRAEERINE